jgi:hypothetical protein
MTPPALELPSSDLMTPLYFSARLPDAVSMRARVAVTPPEKPVSIGYR